MKKHRLLIMFIASSLFISACALTDQLVDRGRGVVDSLLRKDEPIQSEESPPFEGEAIQVFPQEDEETLETNPPEEVFVPQNGRDQASTVNNCYHPYFPVAEGAYWTYQETAEEGYTLRVTEIGQDSFTLVQEMMRDDVVFTVEWYCSDNGILSGSFSQVDFISQADDDDDIPEMVFDTLGWEGETLPSPELMELGYKWTSNYRLSAEFNIEAFSQSFESNVTVDHEIAAIETVTVPAGTFSEAVRVDSRGIVEMTMNVSDTSVPFSSTEFTYSTWYVEGVGMVKSSDEFTGLTNSLELIAYGVD